jgi:hypothetical protein
VVHAQQLQQHRNGVLQRHGQAAGCSAGL